MLHFLNSKTSIVLAADDSVVSWGPSPTYGELVRSPLVVFSYSNVQVHTAVLFLFIYSCRSKKRCMVRHLQLRRQLEQTSVVVAQLEHQLFIWQSLPVSAFVLTISYSCKRNSFINTDKRNAKYLPELNEYLSSTTLEVFAKRYGECTGMKREEK